MENLKAILEALIFVSEAPLSAGRIKEILGECEKSEITAAIGELAREYGERNGGLQLHEVAGGFQFRTNPDLNTWIKKLKGAKPLALSQPAMETLAIIAYRQPVVKADIEKIRGVDVSGPLKGLMDKKLVRMVGRKDVPGKPMLYGTTKKFLEVFNLNALSELPTLRELKELQATPDESSPVQTTLDAMEPMETPDDSGPAELPETDSGVEELPELSESPTDGEESKG